MTAASDGSAFTQSSCRRLRRLGIKGTATVRFDGTALEIRGAEGGEQRIAPARVVRLRSGRDDAIKYGPSYETRLWLSDGGRIVLSVLGMRNAGPYIATMGRFGEAMAAAGELGRMEGGTSVAGSLLFPMLIGPVFVAASIIALFVITEEPWWGRLLVPLIPGVVTALAVMLARRSWPRPVASVAEYRARLAGPAV
jgi:hypothetical protein